MSVRLHSEVRGEGPPCLFVSGTNSDLRVGPTVFDSPLATACTVLAYDHRGMGRSDKPADGYSLARYADDAAELLDEVGWTSCAVVGASFGGMVAQELALRHPARVERLVLACTSSGGAGGASFPFESLGGLSPDERLRRLLPVLDTRWDEAWQATHPDAVAAMAAQHAGSGGGDEAAAAAAVRQLEARALHDTYDRLASIAVPVLVAAGRYDGVAPPANQEALAARIPHAELAWFEGGHLFMVQDRAAYPAIMGFLNG
jgi:3-oxoadipate enol-lactonase